MNKFLFVRHGQSEANAGGYLARPDTKLTELGIDQAHTTAVKLKSYDVDIIACSPMLRAQQTAEIIASNLGIDIAHIKIIEELRERGHGDLEGQPKQHPSSWYYKLDDKYNVETRQQLIERMKQCLTKIRDLSVGSKKVLVVGHALSGYFLIEVASGRLTIDDLKPAEEVLNAAVVEVSLNELK